MAFKHYKYGLYKIEIRKLFRKRLTLKGKIDYHRKKADKFESEELPNIEKEINEILKKTGNKLN